MTDDTFYTMLFAAGMIAAIVFFVWLMRYGLERAYAPLRQRFGFDYATDKNGRRNPRRIEGEWQGNPASIEFEYGGRHRPDRIIFTLYPLSPLPVPGSIRVRRKRLIDRLAVAIGLARRLWKHSYHDAGHAFVEADHDRYAEATVAMTQFRQSVLPLVGYRHAGLAIQGDRISLTLKGPFLLRRRQLKPARVQQIFNQLHALGQLDYPATDAVAAGSPATESDTAPALLHERMRHSPLWPLLRPLTLTASTLLFAGPLLLWWGTWYPPLTWELHGYGFAAGGLLTLIYALLLFPAVRGHSRSLSEFSTYFFFAAVGFPSFLAGVPVVYNGMADTGEPEYREGKVTGRQDGRARIDVRLPDGRTGSVKLKVSDQTYRQIYNKPVHIRVMPGALGYTWAPPKQSLR